MWRDFFVSLSEYNKSTTSFKKYLCIKQLVVASSVSLQIQNVFITKMNVSSEIKNINFVISEEIYKN